MSCHKKTAHVTCHMSVTVKVEKSRQCQAVLSEHFPNACMMENVFDMLQNWPKGKVWSPRELQLVDSFKCCNKVHQQNRDMCLAHLVLKNMLSLIRHTMLAHKAVGLPLMCRMLAQDPDNVACLGAPCTSHSKSLDMP